MGKFLLHHESSRRCWLQCRSPVAHLGDEDGVWIVVVDRELVERAGPITTRHMRFFFEYEYMAG